MKTKEITDKERMDWLIAQIVGDQENEITIYADKDSECKTFWSVLYSDGNTATFGSSLRSSIDQEIIRQSK